MARIRSFIQSSIPDQKEGGIQELWFKNNNAELVKAFTDDGVEALLHFSDDPNLRGHFHCLGDPKTCPFCIAGKKASTSVLLPVYSLSQNGIAILRISKEMAPRKLLPQLLAYLDDPKIDQKLIEISRGDNYDFTTKLISNVKTASVGLQQVAAFLEQNENLEETLKSIYPRYTAIELSSLESIKAQLELRGLDLG
ncbi:hypothetical protein WDW37_08065 [Bdellovibrionota bacterium FG-1]